MCNLVCAGLLASLAIASVADAQPTSAITVGDLPGTRGTWQQGQAVVAAPLQRVQDWFSDASKWPTRFPDTEWSQPLGRAVDGRAIVRFESRIFGRPLTLYLTERPGYIVFDSRGKHVTVQAKVFFERIDDNHTRVIAQATSRVHGIARLFAGKAVRRQKTKMKIRSDLEAVQQLSRSASGNQWRRSAPIAD